MLKYLSGILLTLLFSSSAIAIELCDSSCEVVMTFPEGGSIQASEALTIEFGIEGELELGDSGTVNTNPQPLTTDFSAGGSLALAEGDSISFGVNGRLQLGSGGNINYTSILIDTGGAISITADSIVLGDVTLTGEGSVLLDAVSISVTSGLTQQSGGTLSFVTETSTALSSSVLTVQDVDNDVTISAGTVIDSSNTASTLSTELNISPALVSEASLEGASVNLATPVINNTVGSLTLTVITQELLESFDDGISLPTEDGNNCMMLSGECISITGEKYVVVDGELVAEKNGGGSLNLIALLLLFMVKLTVLYGRRSCREHMLLPTT